VALSLLKHVSVLYSILAVEVLMFNLAERLYSLGLAAGHSHSSSCLRPHGGCALHLDLHD
jgi:hypothetical protein